MKVIAVIQILLLVASLLIPDGRFGATVADCAGDCGCSAEARQSGNCCCSQAGRKGSEKSCCNSKASKEQCCEGDTRTSKRSIPVAGMVTLCPCGASDVSFVMLSAPRFPAAAARIQTLPGFIEASCMMDEKETCDFGPPDTPPPERCSCC